MFKLYSKFFPVENFDADRESANAKIRDLTDVGTLSSLTAEELAALTPKQAYYRVFKANSTFSCDVRRKKVLWRQIEIFLKENPDVIVTVDHTSYDDSYGYHHTSSCLMTASEFLAALESSYDYPDSYVYGGEGDYYTLSV